MCIRDRQEQGVASGEHRQVDLHTSLDSPAHLVLLGAGAEGRSIRVAVGAAITEGTRQRSRTPALIDTDLTDDVRIGQASVTTGCGDGTETTSRTRIFERERGREATAEGRGVGEQVDLTVRGCLLYTSRCVSETAIISM